MLIPRYFANRRTILARVPAFVNGTVWHLRRDKCALARPAGLRDYQPPITEPGFGVFMVLPANSK
ncbi:MAG: hypothetical protein NTU53_10890 [Planctomycetota bacterium]|nr:hypothetical protein [Planctomycetota bacterium]